MTDKEVSLLERITTHPQRMGGKPTIREMRISVEQVLKLLSQGWSWQQVIDGYPDLEPADIEACLMYATKAVEDYRIIKVA